MRSAPSAEPPSTTSPPHRVVEVAHQQLAQVLPPGSLTVDLTAGNGYDTLFLYRCVGPAGKVLAFDIQQRALTATAKRLRDAGAPVSQWSGVAPACGGVLLIHASHCRLDEYLQESPRAVIANLGYLPGGDRSLTTRAGSTLLALDKALARLAPGGRLAVVAYPGHPGGREEGERVHDLIAGLPPRQWSATVLRVANRRQAPYLLLAEKR